MDFKYPQLWQNLDNINAVAGATTHLATAANAQLTTINTLIIHLHYTINTLSMPGVTTHLATAANAQLTTFQALNDASCAFIWIASLLW